MKVFVRFSAKEELKALRILLRHSPGTMLRDDIYAISEEAVAALRSAGVKFDLITTEANPPSREGADAGERI